VTRIPARAGTKSTRPPLTSTAVVTKRMPLPRALQESPRQPIGNPGPSSVTVYECQLERPEDAERHYRQALEIDPKHAYGRNGLGCPFEDAGKRSEACREFMQALTRSQDKDADSLCGVGWVLLRSGGNRAAEAIAQKREILWTGLPRSQSCR
jgi:Tfp pilus assembly protein PilF